MNKKKTSYMLLTSKRLVKGRYAPSNLKKAGVTKLITDKMTSELGLLPRIKKALHDDKGINLPRRQQF